MPQPVAAKPPEITSLEQARGIVVDQHQEIQRLLWQVAQLKKELYGTSSERQSDERFSKEQILLSLFPAPHFPAATQDVLVPLEAAQAPPRARRQPAVKVLETVTERLEPAEKVCPHCGKEKCQIGCERSERFEYIPARIVRHQIERPKLACPCGQSGVSIAPLPPQVLEQGQAGASLIAQVMLSKYDDHQPLYRQRQQLLRLGINFPLQSLCDWTGKGAEWLSAIVRVMKSELLAGDYLQADETPVKVLDPEVPGKSATGWLWVAGRPGGDVIFEFHPGRGHEYARELTRGFKGYLQRDGYNAYGALVKADGDLIPVGCWSHARRKWVEAAELETTAGLEIVTEIRRLYLIERRARDEGMTSQQRWELRQSLARPILLALRPRLESLREQYLPQSPTGKAARYALNEWEPLNRYLEDGRLEIDNNLTENSIRPSAVGKRNWLFIGHPDAGWRSAVIYSVIGSCRRRGIDPWAYVRDVLQRLPGMKQSEVSTLLPRCWKPVTPPES